MRTKSIKENSFDGAPGGTTGTIDFNPSLGTHSSPSVSQNPGAFADINTNAKHYYDPNNTGQPDTRMNSDDVLDADVEKLFSDKKETPTPDEIVCGLDYELSQMTQKDRGEAKRRVISNLKKDTKFYSNLNMLNINDTPPESTEPTNSSPIKERIKILNDLIAEKKSWRTPANNEIQKILDDKQNERSLRTLELLRRPIN